MNETHHGDCRELLPRIEPDSIACSVWSPPYFVGKQYEAYLGSFEDWQALIRDTVKLHFPVIKPGGFLAINIADILCFEDPDMPRIQAENVDRRIWVKDAAWVNSNWTTLSYRAVDEFEYVYIFRKPGITTISRDKLTSQEWAEWGSRAVWEFPSVRANDDIELSEDYVRLARKRVRDAVSRPTQMALPVQ